MSHRSPICCIVPEEILYRLAALPEHRDRALRTLILTERMRGRRAVLDHVASATTSTGRSGVGFMARIVL